VKERHPVVKKRRILMLSFRVQCPLRSDFSCSITRAEWIHRPSRASSCSSVSSHRFSLLSLSISPLSLCTVPPTRGSSARNGP